MINGRRNYDKTEYYKQYLFLVPILKERAVSFNELGEILEEHGFNKGSTCSVINTLTNHVPLYNPAPSLYKILTKEDTDRWEAMELNRRQLKKKMKEGRI